MKRAFPRTDRELCPREKRDTTAITGLLFWPRYDFPQGKPLDKSHIKTKRTAEDVRALLMDHPDTRLVISGHLRGIDGAGSSLDLPEFQKALTPPGAKQLSTLPSTPTIASIFRTTIRFELGSDREAIEYIAPDYGIPERKPHRIRGRVTLDEEGKTSQVNGPAFIFANIFGISGMRIICEEISPMAVAGGMESSNVLNVALIAGASMLSGADLSLADIFSLAVKLENDEFNGLTGGQGHLCCMMGGAYRHVWLSGIKDERGRSYNPYGAFSMQLLSDDDLKVVEEHIALVQAGIAYEGGKPQVSRTAALINRMWTDLLRDKDALGSPLLREKLELAGVFAEALKKKDFQAATAAIIRYVEIRDALCRRWINLAVDAHERKVRSSDGMKLPPHAYRYAEIFDETHPRFNEFQTIRAFYDKDPAALRATSFYTLSPISELVQEAKAAGIAVMPLGAGGPGANLIALSSKGRNHLETFLHARGIRLLTEDAARSVIRGTGTLKGYLPFQAGKEPLTIRGFSELGLQLPEGPRSCVYDEATGRFTALL